MKRIITVLTISLTTAGVSVGQNIRKDIESGLYMSSPDGILIQQLVSDTLRTFKLIESREHYNKITKILFDSIPKRKLYEARKSDTGWGKIDDILRTGKSRYSLVSADDKGFRAINYVKRDIGYEIYFSQHEVKKKEDLVKSIQRDTTTYLKFYIFTESDLNQLNKRKKLNEITEAEFEELLAYIETYKIEYLERVKRSGTRSLYGTIETNEMLVKVLMELKYNPIMMPGDFDRIYKKYKPKR